MKTLLDIQQELRKLENSMNGMINTVNNLSEDVEKLRNDGKKSHMNYEAISKLAKKIPYKNHPLKNIEEGYVCRLYIDVLLNLVRLDTKNALDKLVFIEWIRLESNIDMSLEELQKDSVYKQKIIYDEILEEFSNRIKFNVVIDALVIANINGKANKKSLDYIAQLCAIFGFSKEEVKSYSTLSRIVLCQKVEKNAKITSCPYSLRHYGFTKVKF